jgi:hypothetical protein
MHRFVAYSLLVLLAGCANPTETKISDIDFSDPTSVQRVTQSLDYYDGHLFARYAGNRAIDSTNPNNQITRADGTPPVTVAEAIVLTRDWLAKNDARIRQRDNLLSQRNALIEEQSKLVSEAKRLVDMDGRIRDQIRYDELQRLIAEDKRRVAELNAALAKVRSQKG